MSGPMTLGANALGGNPYITKLGAQGGKDSGLTIQPIQPYKGSNSSSIQNTSAGSPTLGTGIASAVQNLPNTIQQAQKLMQWRNQMNGGLFSQQQPMNANPGGVWAGNPTESQVGPSTPAPDASSGVNTNPVQAPTYASGGSDPGTAPGMASGGSALGMASIGSQIGSSIAAPIEKAGQQEQQIAANLKPDINVQDPMYPIPQVGGGGLVV